MKPAELAGGRDEEEQRQCVGDSLQAVDAVCFLSPASLQIRCHLLWSSVNTVIQKGKEQVVEDRGVGIIY